MKTMYWVLRLIEFPVSTAVAIRLQVMANAAAFVERGYYAIGGEIFVLPLVLIGMIWIFERILDSIRSICRKRERLIRKWRTHRHKGAAICG